MAVKDTMERMEAFKKAVAPVKEWLDKYGDPYTSVVVEHGRAQVSQMEMGIPLKVLD